MDKKELRVERDWTTYLHAFSLLYSRIRLSLLVLKDQSVLKPHSRLILNV